MNNKICLERFDFLRKLGFKDIPDCEPSFAFGVPTVALDTNMIVQGDHADDHAYIYYSCITLDGEILDGFFYAPSLLEHPLMSYQKYDIESILKEIDNKLYCSPRRVFVGGFPMIFVPVEGCYCDIQKMNTPLSDMLKLVAILDYIMSQDFHALLGRNK